MGAVMLMARCVRVSLVYFEKGQVRKVREGLAGLAGLAGLVVLVEPVRFAIRANQAI